MTQPTTERDRVKQRVAKLLNVTLDKGASENEAMMAAEKAATSRGWRSIAATISPRQMAETGSPSTGRAENFCVPAGSRSTQWHGRPGEPARVVNSPTIPALARRGWRASASSSSSRPISAARRDQGRTAVIMIGRRGTRSAGHQTEGTPVSVGKAETEAISSAELEVRIRLPPAVSLQTFGS